MPDANPTTQVSKARVLLCVFCISPVNSPSFGAKSAVADEVEEPLLSIGLGIAHQKAMLFQSFAVSVPLPIPALTHFANSNANKMFPGIPAVTVNPEVT